MPQLIPNIMNTYRDIARWLDLTLSNADNNKMNLSKTINYGLFPLLLGIVLVGCGESSPKKKKSAQQGQKYNQDSRKTDDSMPQRVLPNDNYEYDPSSLSNRAENFGTTLRERISFLGDRGDKVPGYLYFPSVRIKGKLPALMLQYGLGSDKSDGKIKEVAESFANSGYAILVIDIHGVGERKVLGEDEAESNQNQQITQFLGNFNSDSFAWYTADYMKALDYIHTRVEIDTNRIAYGGASWGAITGAAFAVDTHEIKAYISIVGGGNFLGLLNEKFDPYSALQRMKKPTFLINARQDQVIPSLFSEPLHGIERLNFKKKWYDTNHTLDGVDLTELASEIKQFLQDNL